MKNIFLFGAGASYGCGGLNSTVPLGNQLFCELKRRFPGTWGQVSQEIATSFHENFEQGMEKLWSSNFPIISRLMQDLGVYFASFSIANKHENLYVKIIQKLKKMDSIKDTLISTLNYECLIEIAAFLNNIKSNYFCDGDNSSLSVFKLHGSCNFIPELHMNRGANLSSPGAIVHTGFNIVQPNEVRAFCYGDTSLHPVMSIYMKGKPALIAPRKLKAFQEEWKNKIKKASNIIIVGTNPNLEDNHIWDPISESSAQILFCGDETAFRNWQKVKARNDIYLGCTFHDSIDEIIKQL
ncbi:MAG: hypothetical protein KAS93_01090 [Gammaproteobacteria bacterium]|nr:hypothetical protein [Gammaproteobacteria bacterium]